MTTRRLKILKDNGTHKAGEILKVGVCQKGSPQDPFLYRRVRDMKADQNCEWLDEWEMKKGKGKAVPIQKSKSVEKRKAIQKKPYQPEDAIPKLGDKN